MFRWLGKGKRARELATLRARVEQARQDLLPFSAELGSSFGKIEEGWREAGVAEERSQEEAAGLYLELEHRLASARAELLERHPERMAEQLLGRAERILASLGEGRERDEAWLALFTPRLIVAGHGGSAGLERLLALADELTLDPAQLLELFRLCGQATRRLGPVPALLACRKRTAKALLELGAYDPEQDPEHALVLLDLAVAQAEGGDLEDARATLSRLQGDIRDQGQLAIVEAEARAGDPERVRAELESIAGRAMRAQAEVYLVRALARAGRIPEALDTARALREPERRNALVEVLWALGAAGAHAEAQLLVHEFEPEKREDAQLVLFEEALARDDLVRAEELSTDLVREESRAVYRSRMSEVFLARGDFDGALEAARTTGDPLREAELREQVGWARLSAVDPDAGREAFRSALALAAEAMREGKQLERSGALGRWMPLAGRLQAALGDWQSALANVTRTEDPRIRDAGLRDIADACGRCADLEAVDRMLEVLPGAVDRIRLLTGAALGVRAARKAPEGPEED